MSMVTLIRIALRLIEDALRWVLLLFRSTESVRAENLFLRRQLALYVERGVQPRRVDAATRVSLAVLARLFDWRGARVVVQPATMIRWHRAGWRLLWRMKSRAGRPLILQELRELIRRMARENVLWGEERIANELLLKLGIRVSPRTVGNYLPKRPPGRPRGDPALVDVLEESGHGHLGTKARSRRLGRGAAASEVRGHCPASSYCGFGPRQRAHQHRLSVYDAKYGWRTPRYIPWALPRRCRRSLAKLERISVRNARGYLVSRPSRFIVAAAA
jgi:transposase